MLGCNADPLVLRWPAARCRVSCIRGLDRDGRTNATSSPQFLAEALAPQVSLWTETSSPASLCCSHGLTDPRRSFMKRSSLAVRVLLLIVTVLASTVMVEAQFRASLRGTVTDTSGAVVPGATVALYKKAPPGPHVDDSTITVSTFSTLCRPPRIGCRWNVKAFKRRCSRMFRSFPSSSTRSNLEVAIAAAATDG